MKSSLLEVLIEFFYLHYLPLLALLRVLLLTGGGVLSTALVLVFCTALLLILSLALLDVFFGTLLNNVQ